MRIWLLFGHFEHGHFHVKVYARYRLKFASKCYETNLKKIDQNLREGLSKPNFWFHPQKKFKENSYLSVFDKFKKSWIFLAEFVILQAFSLKTLENFYIWGKMLVLYQKYNSYNQPNPKSGFERPSRRFWSIFVKFLS